MGRSWTRPGAARRPRLSLLASVRHLRRLVVLGRVLARAMPGFALVLPEGAVGIAFLGRSAAGAPCVSTSIPYVRSSMLLHATRVVSPRSNVRARKRSLRLPLMLSSAIRACTGGVAVALRLAPTFAVQPVGDQGVHLGGNPIPRILP